MADARLLLAGIGAGGPAGLTLAQFAPVGTAGPVGAAGTAGVQTVTITGTPTAGTFTLTWRGKTTAPIPFNATAAQVTTALRALVGASTVTSAGGPLPTTGVAVTFPAAMPQTLMTADSTALVAGGPVVVANTTPGIQTTNPATALVPATYLDAGLCDQKGLTIKTNTSSNDVKAYGTTAVVRTVISEQKQTFDIDFLETNPVSVAVFKSMPLGSIVPDASGYFRVVTGLPQVTAYAAVFNVVDGANFVRYFAPNCQNISPGDLNIAAGQVIDRPVSFTAYPDSLGNTLYEDYVVNALAA